MPHQVAQIFHRRINLLQVAPATFLVLAIYLAHQGNHVAQITNPRFRQIRFLRPFIRPGCDFVEFLLEPAQVGASGAAQGPAQVTEISD